MKSLSLLNQKQREAVDHIYEYGETLLIGDMGSGKTVVVLNAIKDLILSGEAKRVVVFSTPKICKTVWKQDAEDWAELAYLAKRMAVCTGSTSPAEREALIRDPSNYILLVTFDLIPWFFETFKHDHGCDMLVIDESTKLAAGGKQFKALRRYLGDFTTCVCTTGTPVEENWQQIFYQIMLCDNGKSLGKRKDKFLEQYFYPTDYERRNWALRPASDKLIFNAVNHLICTLPDYRHELPPLTETVHYVELDQEARDYYEAFKHDMVDDARDIEAVNAAVLVNKLQQVACGFIYKSATELEEKEVHYIHSLKDAALLTLLDTGKKTIVAYQYEEELRRFELMIGEQYRIRLNPDETEASIKAWETNPDIAYLTLHPKSASHGLRLTAASKLILLSPIWSRDQTKQLIARMHRRGQQLPCELITLCTRDTIEEGILERVDEKGANQKLLKQHLKEV